MNTLSLLTSLTKVADDIGKYEKHIVTFENYAGKGKYVALYAPGGKASTSITNYIDDIQIAGKKRLKIKELLLGFRGAEEYKFE